jgi:hypothetical protein
MKSSRTILFLLLCLCLCAILGLNCDDEATNSEPEPETYTLDATHCTPLEITVVANETISLTVTDSVHTNPGGVVVECDFWTDADGIPTCPYVGTVSELNNLPFMALVGSFDTEWFVVGTSFDTVLTEADTLMLKVNDWGPCAELSDNAGQFVITVERN